MTQVVIANEELGSRANVHIDSVPVYEGRGWAILGPADAANPLLTIDEAASEQAAAQETRARLQAAAAPAETPAPAGTAGAPAPAAPPINEIPPAPATGPVNPEKEQANA